ncbi:MAG: hypothetical protein ACFB6R_04595 [Alphaproteobacteria bacterium]
MTSVPHSGVWLRVFTDGVLALTRIKARGGGLGEYHWPIVIDP